jgi:DNA-binding response OmpR family regulator
MTMINHRISQSSAAIPPNSEELAKPRKNTHVLIVDDEEPLRRLLRILLEGIGYTVSTASNGREALSTFGTAAFDIALIDILMPDMDGYTLCHELRKRSSVPIIMVSALNRTQAVVQGLDNGADDYITKPFQLRDIDLRIQALLRRVAWHSNEPVRVN